MCIHCTLAFQHFSPRGKCLHFSRNILVELSGNCPPSPKDLAGDFSRLSFEFSLRGRLLETGMLPAADPISFETDFGSALRL